MTDDHDLNGLHAVLVQRNLWLNQQLHNIDDWLGETQVDGLPLQPWQEELTAILQRKRPPHIGPAESCRVSFHWRDRDRPDGYADALPGDGYGFAKAVEGFGLRMTFDCAGILACADLSFDALRVTLAKEGYGLVNLRDRGNIEHLTTRLYGTDDEPTLELPPEALEKMAALVENPPKPSEALKAAAARYWKKPGKGPEQ